MSQLTRSLRRVATKAVRVKLCCLLILRLLKLSDLTKLKHLMEELILLNTYHHRMDSLVTPEAIATFSKPGIKRYIIRGGARLSDYGWRTGYQNQLHKFFYDAEQRDIMLPVLTHQAMDIRNAFFQLNDSLNQEANKRTKEKQRLSEYQGSVVIIFGNEDPYLNRGVAQEFNEIFTSSSLYLIDNAAHYLQLDKPNDVAERILESRTLLDQKNTNSGSSTLIACE